MTGTDNWLLLLRLVVIGLSEKIQHREKGPLIAKDLTLVLSQKNKDRN